jgi:hypothetical protein
MPRTVTGGAPSKKPVTCKGSCIGAHPKFRAEKSKSRAFEIFELSSGEIQGQLSASTGVSNIPGVKVQAGSLRDFVV